MVPSAIPSALFVSRPFFDLRALSFSSSLFLYLYPFYFRLHYFYGVPRVRVVKLVVTPGTMHACNGGHPGSVTPFRHKDVIALLTCAGLTIPFSGSA